MRQVRCGVTLVEMLLALSVSLVVMTVIWAGLRLLVKSEQSIDRAATRALVQARMLQYMLMDMRSSKEVQEVSDKEYRIVRYLPEGGQLKLCRVVWRKTDDHTIERRQEGQASREFSFSGLLDEKMPGVELRIERVRDAIFQER